MRTASFVNPWPPALLCLQVLLLGNLHPVHARIPPSSQPIIINDEDVSVLDLCTEDVQHNVVGGSFQLQGVMHGSAGVRALQQEPQVAELTVVTFPEELLDAIDAGAQHIEIRDHLDLTTVQPRDSTDTKRMLNADIQSASDFGQSIRGNCTVKTSSQALHISGVAPIRQQKDGQCVIVTDLHLMSVFQNLWLDNLYIRHLRTPRTKVTTDIKSVVWCGSEDCNLWLTSITLQGDGNKDPEQGGLAVHGGQAYAQDLVIMDFASHASALFVASGATVLLNTSIFSHNVISDAYPNSAVISANAVDPQFNNGQQQDTILRLQNCTIAKDNSNSTLQLAAFTGIPYSDFDVSVFSDVDREVLRYADSESTSGTTLSLVKSPASRPGIDASSPWFVNLKSLEPQEQIFIAEGPFSALPEAVAFVDSPSPAPEAFELDEDTNRSPIAPSAVSDPENNTERIGNKGVESAGTVIGAVAAALVACNALVCLLVKYRKRKRLPTGGEVPQVSAQRTPARIGDVSQRGNISRPILSREQTPKPFDDNVQNSMLEVSNESPFQACQTVRSTTGEPLIDHEHHNSSGAGLHLKAFPSASDVPAVPRQPHPRASYPQLSSASVRKQTKPKAGVTWHYKPIQASDSVWRQVLGLFVSPEKTNDRSEKANHTTVDIDTFDLTRTAAPLIAPPAPNDSLDAKMDFLQQQLDSFGTDTIAMNDLVFLGRGHKERLQGGQAVVQMARSKTNGIEYAIKFFVSEAAFKVEQGMYSKGSGVKDSNLAQFLPRVLGMYLNKDGALKDFHGYALPPCIVMERGESLDLWAARAQPDRPQAFMMINQLAYRLMELHSLGYVHRDLKPGNVMWLPRENRWTVIDFGCMAKAGSTAKIAFSVAYAAPEVISAYRQGNQHVVVQEAADAWSLGVMAFELLTGKSAFKMVEGKENVMDRIQGLNGLQLPWDANVLSAQDQGRLGVFTASITALLSKDPSQRPSMEQFCESCNKVLAGSTSVHVE